MQNKLPPNFLRLNYTQCNIKGKKKDSKLLSKQKFPFYLFTQENETIVYLFKIICNFECLLTFSWKKKKQTNFKNSAK